ncbi:hypothetical protein ACELLULO517_14195 [Acidisoma cellulosilytica]|uniref:REDY-like protein HapK n=1 Tax=Acidisoma cellulosilyticum TaxID=2802395 RepID=A0A963Z2N7_9PROT|nr:hypothetical protein [Acidisoma cellulosilyticum]MCB8881396.1 hypothetical protein [Acidisoma cellulosilyticum]
MRIFVLFNLKPGVSKAEYLAWAKQTDLPIVRGLDSVASFEVFEVTSLLGSDQSPPYDYIEVVEVKDMDAFGKDVAQEIMQRVAAEFQAIATPQFLLSRSIEAAQ